MHVTNIFIPFSKNVACLYFLKLVNFFCKNLLVLLLIVFLKLFFNFCITKKKSNFFQKKLVKLKNNFLKKILMKILFFNFLIFMFDFFFSKKNVKLQ